MVPRFLAEASRCRQASGGFRNPMPDSFGSPFSARLTKGGGIPFPVRRGGRFPSPSYSDSPPGSKSGTDEPRRGRLTFHAGGRCREPIRVLADRFRSKCGGVVERGECVRWPNPDGSLRENDTSHREKCLCRPTRNDRWPSSNRRRRESAADTGSRGARLPARPCRCRKDQLARHRLIESGAEDDPREKFVPKVWDRSRSKFDSTTRIVSPGESNRRFDFGAGKRTNPNLGPEFAHRGRGERVERIESNPGA